MPEPVMHREDIQRHLTRLSKQLQLLADSLSDEGRRLEEYEVEMIRFAFYSQAKEMTREMLIAFIGADDRWIERLLDSFHGLNHSINQL